MNSATLRSLQPLRLCTHSGRFHADDLVATAIMAVCAGGLDFIAVDRSRNPSDWERAHVVVDVGGKFEVGPNKAWLDHHQSPGPDPRPNGLPYAAAGLTWLTFGQIAIREVSHDLSADEVDQVWTMVEHSFIRPIDAADNGVELVKDYHDQTLRPLTYSQVLDSCNAPWSDFSSPLADKVLFRRILYNQVYPNLLSVIRQTVAAVKAKAILPAALDKRPVPGLLVLDVGLPWQEGLLKSPAGKDVMFVVFPDQDGSWRLQGVPTTLGGYTLRKKLPREWAGLRNKEECPGDVTLADVTAVEDAIFCHKMLFIAGARSLAGAVALGKLALTEK